MTHKMLLNRVISAGVCDFADDQALSTRQLVEIITEKPNKNPKLLLIKAIAKVGDNLKLPLNSEQLKKLTENYIVSNNKIKKALAIDNLPFYAEEGRRNLDSEEIISKSVEKTVFDDKIILE